MMHGQPSIKSVQGLFNNVLPTTGFVRRRISVQNELKMVEKDVVTVRSKVRNLFREPQEIDGNQQSQYLLAPALCVPSSLQLDKITHTLREVLCVMYLYACTYMCGWAG